jgi:hypothetical protein
MRISQRILGAHIDNVVAFGMWLAPKMSSMGHCLVEAFDAHDCAYGTGTWTEIV